MPVVVTTGHEVQTCRNCGAPQLQFLTRWADVPVYAVHRQGLDVPVILHDKFAQTVGGASASVIEV